MSKAYLGDGVYVQEDPDRDGTFWLTTENGISVTNRICIEPRVFDAMLEKLPAGLRPVARCVKCNIRMEQPMCSLCRSEPETGG